MKGARLIISVFLALALALPAFSPAEAATWSATINFEGLTEGSIVSSLSNPLISGYIGVFGYTPDQSGNMAMIFDATCSPTATGGDDDLCNTSLGNVLIVSEDGDSSDPDDSDNPNIYLEFDFSHFDVGSVNVISLVYGDNDDNEVGHIKLYTGASLLADVPLAYTGDGNYSTKSLGYSGVTRMVVYLGGSGAIDNIQLEGGTPPPPTGDEGCTPGYWKNHTGAWTPTGYSPGQSLESVFNVPDSLGMDSDTLMQALNYHGGKGVDGAAHILMRAAVAALLNAAHPDVAYQWTEAQVIQKVNTELATLSRNKMLNLKDKLDDYNNYGCPLN